MDSPGELKRLAAIEAESVETSRVPEPLLSGKGSVPASSNVERGQDLSFDTPGNNK
jgi:hypothetical protein